MRRFLAFFIFLFLLFSLFPKVAQAAPSDYVITDFQSSIEVEQDTSLLVTETIKTEFYSRKHGIYRVIPIVYSARGRTIKAKFDLLSVTDEEGNPYQYKISRYRQSIKIRIGDPDKTITGFQTYIIEYKIKKILQRYPEHDELYWNVTGSEWDTVIENASAKVSSPWAEITKVSCFPGRVETNQECQASFTSEAAFFSSATSLGIGNDFTIVVGLNSQSQLQFPGLIEKSGNLVVDNWGYPLSILPLLIIFAIWFKKGRDQRFLADTVYYQPEDQRTRVVFPLERKYLPMVYSPIKGLTPAQVGTILDERVDIQDLVAEIVELARLGFIEIKKTEKRGLVRRRTDYLFTKKEKDRQGLKKYQEYLLDKIFDGNKEEVKLSELKGSFYQHLEEFKKKLYQDLSDNKIFDGNPEKVRGKWLLIFTVLQAAFSVVTVIFSISTYNFVPFVFGLVLFVPGIFLAFSMPRRTAWGYSLFRQTDGLRHFLKKGEWRYKIAEKHLFIEEVLPLAISLGVVRQLTKHMQDLKMKPPDYVSQIAVANFSSNFRSFQSQAARSFAPSGRSSWSGGSGFGGGGFSGGGFGGGGGGSW